MAARTASPDALRRLADEYYTRGLFGPRQLGVYEKAVALAPDEPRYAEALSIACFLRQLRRFTVEFAEPEYVDPEGAQESIEVIKEYLREHSASPDLFDALGDMHLVRGNTLLAIGAYENAIHHGFADYWAILRSFEFASRIHKFPPGERAYFAGLYSTVGLTEKALELLRGIVGEGFHDRGVVASLVDLIRLGVEQETNTNARNAAHMEIAELYLSTGDTERALEAFSRVSFPISQNFSLVKRIAAILIDMQDYKQAFDYLSQIPVDEENKALINRITVELEQAGDLDTAVHLLQFINDNDLVIREAEALREKELEIHTELELAGLNMAARRYDLAMSNYIRVLQLGYRDDLELLAKIVELLPLLRNDHIADLHFLGEYYLSKNDYYRAAQFYDLILERRPDDAKARGKLRSIYSAILDRNPDLPELRLRSGELYEQEGDLAAALAEYHFASQYPETNVEAMRRMAVAHIKSQNFSEAFEAYQQIPASELDLENLYQLHLILAGQDRHADALALLRQIADVRPDYRDAAERAEALSHQVMERAEQLPVDEKMRELIGDVAVGRYRYMEKIGSGGMGVVHKVYDLRLERPVAMKILREGLANSNKAVERFFREARIAATLNHPNIVNIYDYNINNQTHKSYISMEYVDGPSLRDLFEEWIVAEEPLTPERITEAVYYTAQICDALQVTHSKGIIHRDIKPDNILISADQQAKLTDFGIVHVEEATFTPTGAVIGTPRYMSPEQVQGHRLDGRADLYSVGIILYEWLTGAPPFVSGDIAYQQVNVRPVFPSDHNALIPRDLNDIIMKCLEKAPADRYQSAADLKAALEGVLRRMAPFGLPAGRQSASKNLAPPPDDPDLDEPGGLHDSDLDTF